MCGNSHPNGERKKNPTLLQINLAKSSDKAVSMALPGAWEQNSGEAGMCKQERRVEGWEISGKGSPARALLRDKALAREGIASPLQDAGTWFYFVIKGHLASGSGMDNSFTL